MEVEPARTSCSQVQAIRPSMLSHLLLARSQTSLSKLFKNSSTNEVCHDLMTMSNPATSEHTNLRGEQWVCYAEAVPIENLIINGNLSAVRSSLQRRRFELVPNFLSSAPSPRNSHQC